MNSNDRDCLEGEHFHIKSFSASSFHHKTPLRHHLKTNQHYSIPSLNWFLRHRIMSSRRYSLPSLKNGGIKFGFGGLGGMGFGSSSSKKKSEYPSHHQTPSSFFASTRHHDKFFRGPSGSSPSSPINASDAKVVHLKRVMQSVHPGHCRLLPGHQQLFHIFGNRRVDRLNSKIDCDEVYPNMFIGNE